MTGLEAILNPTLHLLTKLKINSLIKQPPKPLYEVFSLVGKDKDSVGETAKRLSIVLRVILIIYLIILKPMEGRTTLWFESNKKDPLRSLLNGGQRWIRTTVPSREQIYSLSPLATRPSTHI